ncbi:MAG TPA: hypothetical protein PLB18_08305 [Acidobacteriota bacterium]|nr:hypothetical protein [Acidobacteriota bacterium]
MTFWFNLVEKMARDYVSLQYRGEKEKTVYQIVTNWLALLKREDVTTPEVVELVNQAEAKRTFCRDFSVYLADQLKDWAISTGYIPAPQPKVIQVLDFANDGEFPCATVRWKTVGAARYIKQSSCPSRFAVLSLEISPVSNDQNCQLRWYVTGDQIPPEFQPAVKEAIETYQRNYIKTEKVALMFDVAVIFGRYHEVDSNFFSFKVATRMALEKAFEANSLEPIPGRK